MKIKKFISKKTTEYLDYLFSEPLTTEKAPLVIYIHGAGSRGEDANLLRENTAIQKIYENVKDTCFFAAPQCHVNYWFTVFETLSDFIDTVRQDERVDIDRVYIIGSSMGGYTVWQMILSHTEWFAAAMPICGGGMYWAAAELKSLPIWAFHGALDATVLPEESVHMVKAVNAAGGDARFTVYPKTAHRSWDDALSDKAVWDWLFKQKKK